MLQTLERERDAMHLELHTSRKQCSDAADEVRSCQAAAVEHAKMVRHFSLPALISRNIIMAICCTRAGSAEPT